VKELEGDLGEYTSQSSRVTCVINFCGPQDMGAPLMQGDAAKKDDPAVSGLFGGPLADHADAVKAASPLTYVSKSSVPTMTVHGTNDLRVDYKHAEWIDAALKKAGVESLLIPMAGGGHGFPIGDDLKGRMNRFWDRHLRGVKDGGEIATTPIEVPAAAAK
jgi:acetyl esterase/lipase